MGHINASSIHTQYRFDPYYRYEKKKKTKLYIWNPLMRTKQIHIATLIS